MDVPDQHEITELLGQWNAGNKEVLDRLMPLVTVELQRMAGRFFSDEKAGHTLQPTALVSELYLRLLGRRSVTWETRAHFFGFAAETMRRILVDHARGKGASKRGGEVHWVGLDEGSHLKAAEGEDLLVDILDLDAALHRLAEVDARLAKVIELRAFAGLQQEEIAHLLSVSLTTVWRDWTTARAWLFRELGRG